MAWRSETATTSPEWLHEMVTTFANAFMSAEADQRCDAVDWHDDGHVAGSFDSGSPASERGDGLT
ncbi:MAG: hypothetical protein GEU86_15710 [Actinophytocola sp.]|nr:hypothetical protein [Actinophytocola sp.]